MESEKIEKIKKVLKQNTKTCLLYDFGKDTECKVFQCKDILTYINELESENERLENKNYQLEQDLGQCENGYKLELHTARYELHTKNEEIEKLKKYIERVESERIRIKKDRDKKEELASKFIDSYNDSLKQFAEKLKDEAFLIFMGETIVRGSKIDEILKEFTGGEK